MTNLTPAQRRIAEFAAPLFLDRGLRRTTMADIAVAAGLSRQGLYYSYPDRESVFAAVVRLLNARLIADIRSALAGAEGLRGKLDLACARWLAAIYDLQQRNPDVRDMDDLGLPVVREAYDAFIDLVADIVRGERPLRDGSDIMELSRLLVFASRGLNNASLAPALTQALMVRQIDLIMAALDDASSGDPI